MANYLIYNVMEIGVIGSEYTLAFSDTVYEYDVTLSANTVLSINTSDVTPAIYRKIIRITMPSTVYSVTFPNNVTWDRGFPPCMNVPDHVYIVELFTRDGGTSYSGKWICEMEA